MVVLRFRLCLALLSAAMLLCSLAVLAWSLAVPCQVELAVPGAKRVAGAPSAASEARARLSLEDFAPLLVRRLQAPLFDPPPKKPAAVVKNELPPPPLKLLATMPEPGGGCAMFADASGGTLVKSLGDQIAGGGVAIEVVEIANDHVVVRQEKRLITLKLTQ